MGRGFQSIFAIAALCGAGFGVIAFLVQDARMAGFDLPVIRFVQGMEFSVLTAVMKCFALIGAGWPAAAISLLAALLLFKFMRCRTELILFFWVVVGSSLLNLGLKELFQRARPSIYRMMEIGGYSFPSGHAMSAFSLYGMIVLLVWHRLSAPLQRAALLIFGLWMIGMIGICRIYLGVHYPSDVLGGFLASAFWMACSVWLYRAVRERRRRRQSELP